MSHEQSLVVERHRLLLCCPLCRNRLGQRNTWPRALRERPRHDRKVPRQNDNRSEDTDRHRGLEELFASQGKQHHLMASGSTIRRNLVETSAPASASRPAKRAGR